MKISLIIPMYNESKIIENTAMLLSDYMKASFDDYEIIFFDDGSQDNSRQLVKDLCLPRVRVLGYECNHGKGCAVRHAMLEADGDIRIFTDADLAYGTDVINAAANMLSKRTESDVLIGSRNIGKNGYQGYTFTRRIMSKAYIKILCIAGGFKLSDSQCGFKAFRGEAAEQIFSECTVDGFAFDFEVILRATDKGLGICELPVRVINHRESSVRPISDAFKMLGDIKRIKRDIKHSQAEVKQK